MMMQGWTALMGWRPDVLRGRQRVMFGAFFFALGVVLVGPWWREALQNWQTVNEAEALALVQQKEVQDLQRQTQGIWAEHQPTLLIPDVQRISTSLSAQGLVVFDVGMERALTDHRSAGFQVAQVPVRVGVEGDWSHWQDWLRQLPVQMPGTTLTALDIQSGKAERFMARLTLNMPQIDDDEVSGPFPLTDWSQDVATSLMDSRSWQATQQVHAQSRATMPDDVSSPHRVKDPLEFFNRSQLQYVGVIGWGDTSQALVRVNDPRALTTLYRVPVGGRLGKDAGRVRVINSDHLLIDEWVQDVADQWRSQEVRMPLWLGAVK